MKNYRTSHDYRRLRRLLDSGCEVICSAFGGTLCRAVIDNTDDDPCYYVAEEFQSVKITDSQFCEWCRDLDLEYVVPECAIL